MKRYEYRTIRRELIPDILGELIAAGMEFDGADVYSILGLIPDITSDSYIIDFNTFCILWTPRNKRWTIYAYDSLGPGFEASGAGTGELFEEYKRLIGKESTRKIIDDWYSQCVAA